jgi:SPP1 family predicted phage head-tail adaptor
MQAGDLRNRVEFFEMKTQENEIGQDKRVPVSCGKRWAQIVPQTGTQKNVQGDAVKTKVTHKVVVRRGLSLKNDMLMQYKGQQYRVKYWQPVYNNDGFVEILVEMEQNV